MAEHPDLDIHVVVNPEPLSELDEEADATPLVKSGAAHHRNRRYAVEHTYRKITDYFNEKLEAVGSITEAEELTAKRFACSTRKVWIARDFRETA